MIRASIVAIFRRYRTPQSFENIAAELGMTVQEIRDKLIEEDPLDDLGGLPLNDAFALIEFYGQEVMFTAMLAQEVRDAVLTNQRLKRIEKRKRDEGKLPPPSGGRSSTK